MESDLPVLVLGSELHLAQSSIIPYPLPHDDLIRARLEAPSQLPKYSAYPNDAYHLAVSCSILRMAIAKADRP